MHNYNPFGVNPYQLGINAIMILLKRRQDSGKPEERIKELDDMKEYPK